MIMIFNIKGAIVVRKINKTSESRYFSELDSFGNKIVDIDGVSKRKDVWTSPESLKKIYEKDNVL